jgi:hypothetical protein
MFKAAISLVQSLLLAAALASVGTQGVSAAPEATFALSFSLGNELFLAPQPAAPAQAPLASADGAVRAGATVKPAGAPSAAGKSAGSGDLGGAGDAGATDVDGDLDGDDAQYGPPHGPVSPATAVALAASARYAPSLPQRAMVPLVPPPRRLPS